MRVFDEIELTGATICGNGHLYIDFIVIKEHTEEDI